MGVSRQAGTQARRQEGKHGARVITVCMSGAGARDDDLMGKEVIGKCGGKQGEPSTAKYREEGKTEAVGRAADEREDATG